jgi:hypothetical protein
VGVGMALFRGAMSKRIFLENVSLWRKKKFKGFPMFFPLKISKTALLGHMKLWSSRRYRHRRRLIVIVVVVIVIVVAVAVVVVEPCQCRWKNKSDEEAKKKQIKGLAGRRDTHSLFQTPHPA